MNNIVLVESKLRQKLRLTCTLLCVFCLCSIAVLVCVAMIGNKNLNGQTNEVTGTLDKVYETDSNVLTLHDGKEYNVVWQNDVDVDMNDYKGKTVTLVVTQETFANANPWVLGLVVDGNTIVDYRDTLNYQTESNNEMKTVVIIVTAVLCAVTCGVFVWRFNVKPVAERELYREFGEFLAHRQPTCRERKKSAIAYVCIYAGVLAALIIAGIILDPDSETYAEMTVAAKAVMWTFVSVAVGGLAGTIVLMRWIKLREIDFYAKSLPFDFYDISHLLLRKKVKEQLQQELLKDRELHPDAYADGGNGYDVTFSEKGVFLTAPYDEDGSVELPKAEEVFSFNDRKAQPNNLTVADNIYDISSGARKDLMFIAYDQLNLEAVAHYRKFDRPMIIIIKSRLNRSDDFPEEFVNDLHIALDINLLKTLQKYNVEVENLDYLLANKKQLMLENCLIIGRKKD